MVRLSTRTSRHLAAALATSVVLPLLGGCRAHRTLTITSDPSDARILLDDQVIGETPHRHEFYHYGVRRVCLSKEGHRTCSQLVELEAPWYGRFPLDIVSEVLLPIGWRDRRHVELVLPEGEEEFSIPGIQSVVERARVLREAGPGGPKEVPPREPRLLPQVPVDPMDDSVPPGEQPTR